MLTIEVTGDTELIARLEAMPQVVRQALNVKIQTLTFALEAKVKQKLSGEVLNVRTGQLRNSIHSDVRDNGDAIIGHVYSASNSPASKYAFIHEFGGYIPERIPVNAKALRFVIGGKEIFAKRASGFQMPERSYMRSSLKDMRDQIILEMKQTVADALRKK